MRERAPLWLFYNYVQWQFATGVVRYRQRICRRKEIGCKNDTEFNKKMNNKCISKSIRTDSFNNLSLSESISVSPKLESHVSELIRQPYRMNTRSELPPQWLRETSEHSPIARLLTFVAGALRTHTLIYKFKISIYKWWPYDYSISQLARISTQKYTQKITLLWQGRAPLGNRYLYLKRASGTWFASA